MHPPLRATLAKHWQQFRSDWTHAFAVSDAGVTTLTPEQTALLERIADAVVARGMAAPAVVFLESLGPMSFLGSQALHVLTPIMEMTFRGRDVEDIAVLLERRETVARLVSLLEARSAR